MHLPIITNNKLLISFCFYYIISQIVIPISSQKHGGKTGFKAGVIKGG